MSSRTRPRLTSFLVAAALATAAVAAIGGIAVGRSADRAATPAATSGRSLADAAGSPSGVAAGDQPAADVGTSGASRRAVQPEQVLGSASDRVASTGCRVDYGTDDQCLPVNPPSAVSEADAATASARWTCTELRRMFPDGVGLRAPPYDPLGLDHDGDGVACDPDDGA